MKRILVRLDRRVKLQLRRMRRRTKDKGMADRCQIVLLADKGRSRPAIAEAVGCSVSWVGRVLGRFRDCGVAGLYDRREDNGTLKLDEGFLSLLTTWWTTARRITASRGPPGRGNCWRS